MSIGYIPFLDGAKLGTIRNKINSFNEEVSTLLSTVETVTLDNESRIQDIESNFSLLSNKVGVIEGVVYYYEFVNYSNVDVPNTSYTVVGTLTLDNVPDGVYEAKVLGTYTYDSTTSSAYLRISLDGGSSWEEFRREPKDKVDLEVFNYIVPINVVGGSVHIVVEGKKEVVSAIFNLANLTLVLDRKK